MQKVLILGLGKVGTLVALLLKNSGFQVTGADSVKISSKKFDTICVDVKQARKLKKILKNYDAVVSCLPYHLNLPVAKAAFETKTHYFDLTEDVDTTEAIKELSKKADVVMAPQCGLAPGFIAIVGANLARKYKKIRSIELRVGALPQHPKGEIGYAFNWSPEGVVNEYLNDCIAIKEGKLKTIPAMQDLEKIVINGDVLEAFTTSGGLGTMCDSYLGKVEELNYKTMRYPGHCKLMKVFFHELLMKEDRMRAGDILVNAKPPVSDDVVYVHAAVEGWKKKGVGLYREEFVKAYYPRKIDGENWRAISWTTACSVASVVELVAEKKIIQKGFLRQEEINLADFLTTKHGRMYTEN